MSQNLANLFQPALQQPATPKPHAPPVDDYAYARELASQHMALRLVYSAMQEGILAEGATLLVQDQKGETTLHNASEVYDYLYTRPQLATSTLALQQQGSETPIDDISAFLNETLRPNVIKRVPEASDNANWLKFQHEVLDSLNHETLAVLQKMEVKQSLQAASSEHEHFWDWLTSDKAQNWLENQNHDVDSFLLQLSAFSGHPTHPSSKMRLQLDPEGTSKRFTLEAHEAAQYFPEFAPDVDLALYAVRKDRTTSLTAEGFPNYGAFMQASFPEAYTQWEDTLETKLGDGAADDYIPIPAHPLQQDEIATRFADDLEQGVVVALPDVTVSQRPTLSTRTLTPVDDVDEPQVKTTINMQMTSVVRTIAPGRAYNSPIYSDLLHEVAEQDDSIASKLRLLKEEATAYYGTDPDDTSTDYKQGYHLAAVYKQNPAQLVDANTEMRIPVAALLRDTPFGSTSMICDIMQANGVSSADEAKEYFKAYADVVVSGEVGMLARYGLGLEGHQQNDDMVFDKQTGLPKAVVYRDINGGIEVSEPLLLANGRDLAEKLHPLKKGMCPSIELPMQQTMHTTFQSHLFPLIAEIADTFDVPKSELFSELKQSVEATLDAAEAQHLPHLLANTPEAARSATEETYRTELGTIREGLLSRDMETKCLLGMRLAQTQSMRFDTMPNPLARL